MRRSITISLALGAVAALLASSLQASAAPKPSIEDPVGDANFINDQGTGDGSFGDFNQADAGTVSDIIAVTFSNDAKNLLVNIQTEAAPPAVTGIGYRVRVNPDGAGGAYCINIEAYHPGANNVVTQAVAFLRDGCDGGAPVELKVIGTQITVPLKLAKLARGDTLKAPQAQAFLYSGEPGGNGATYPVADTTKVGTDYKLK